MNLNNNLEYIGVDAVCYSQDGHSIGFGVSVPKDGSPDDGTVDFLCEAMCDSISENWEEFEDVAKEAEIRCSAYLKENGTETITEDQADALVRKILSDLVGVFQVSYAIDGEPANLNYDIDVNKIACQHINEIFAIGFGLAHRK